jgi:hypothetical protein
MAPDLSVESGPLDEAIFEKAGLDTQDCAWPCRRSFTGKSSVRVVASAGAGLRELGTMGVVTVRTVHYFYTIR